MTPSGTPEHAKSACAGDPSMEKAEGIARAVLYEGYILYPYRASSTKNRRRYAFGTLYPEKHPSVLEGSEACRNQTQCLVRGSAASIITARVRFLHMRSRVRGAGGPGADERVTAVDPLQVSGEMYQSWEEAVERAVDAEVQLGEVIDRPRTLVFEFPASTETTDVSEPGAPPAGRMRETQCAIAGRIGLSAELVRSPDLFRLTVEVVNATSGTAPVELLSSFLSTHSVLAIRGGEFLSLLDPAEAVRAEAAACVNVGTYPVLVGEPGEHGVILSSPIILYDYPQIAPESAGDFFDSTEMDELLTLRVMTLTDEEKREMRSGDERVRELLDRTEATARQQLARTHGVVRSLRRIQDDKDDAA